MLRGHMYSITPLKTTTGNSKLQRGHSTYNLLKCSGNLSDMHPGSYVYVESDNLPFFYLFPMK